MDEMADILKGVVQVHSHCYRSDEILMLLGLSDEFHFRLATLQHVLEGYKVAREVAAHHVGAGMFSDWWGYKAEAYDAIPYNAALMVRAGASVAINSDSDELARRLNLEAAKTMKYGGLTEEQALATITIEAAKQLGLGHRIGSIEAGKDADLAIFNGHPFSTYSRVDTTMIEGVVYFDRAKDLAARKELAREKQERLKKDAEQAKNEKKEKNDAKND